MRLHQSAKRSKEGSKRVGSSTLRVPHNRLEVRVQTIHPDLRLSENCYSQRSFGGELPLFFPSFHKHHHHTPNRQRSHTTKHQQLHIPLPLRRESCRRPSLSCERPLRARSIQACSQSFSPRDSIQSTIDLNEVPDEHCLPPAHRTRTLLQSSLIITHYIRSSCALPPRA